MLDMSVIIVARSCNDSSKWLNIDSYDIATYIWSRSTPCPSPSHPVWCADQPRMSGGRMQKTKECLADLTGFWSLALEGYLNIATKSFGRGSDTKEA